MKRRWSSMASSWRTCPSIAVSTRAYLSRQPARVTSRSLMKLGNKYALATAPRAIGRCGLSTSGSAERRSGRVSELHWCSRGPGCSLRFSIQYPVPRRQNHICLTTSQNGEHDAAELTEAPVRRTRRVACRWVYPQRRLAASHRQSSARATNASKPCAAPVQPRRRVTHGPIRLYRLRPYGPDASRTWSSSIGGVASEPDLPRPFTRSRKSRMR